MNSIRSSLLALVATAALTVAAEAKPNILFILADDHGVGAVGCYGGILGKTPRIDPSRKSPTTATIFRSTATRKLFTSRLSMIRQR